MILTVPAAELVAQSAAPEAVANSSPTPAPIPKGSATLDAGIFHAGVRFAVPVAQFDPVPPTNYRVVPVADVLP